MTSNGGGGGVAGEGAQGGCHFLLDPLTLFRTKIYHFFVAGPRIRVPCFRSGRASCSIHRNSLSNNSIYCYEAL